MELGVETACGYGDWEWRLGIQTVNREWEKGPMLAVPLTVAVAEGWGLQATVLDVRLGEGGLKFHHAYAKGIVLFTR